MKVKYFLLTSALFWLLFVFAYITMFYYQLGSQVKAEWWIRDVYYYKDYLASQVKGKKIIIISGSNALFGINSKIIKKHTGYDIVNLSTHAVLDMDFMYYKIKKHIKKGDIVVMPLELNFYFRKEKLSESFINNMMAWGKYDYLNEIPLLDFMYFIYDSPKKRILEGFKASFYDKDASKKITADEVIDYLNKLSDSELDSWKGYSYKSLNLNGEFNINAGVINSVYESNPFYINSKNNLSSSFVKKYKKIESLVQENSGKLILTYPATMRNINFDISNRSTQKRLLKLETSLSKFGIDMSCNPALFNIDRKYFFDTRYHLNKYGTIIRSENLGVCLKKMINDTEFKISNMDAINRTKYLEEKYSTSVIQPELSYFKKRKNDLIQIKKALDKYYIEHGSYPVSLIFSRHNDQKEEWISGLVPKYIEKLPRDPRKLEDDKKQYMYRSDGKDYKLISHLPEDCKAVQKNYPELVDPKRNCWAYGFWSERAMEW